jgi:hypothetical protein
LQKWGTNGGTIHDLVVAPIGERSAIATFKWKNFALMEAWQGSGSRKTSFALPKGWRILAATFHLNAALGQ